MRPSQAMWPLGRGNRPLGRWVNHVSFQIWRERRRLALGVVSWVGVTGVDLHWWNETWMKPMNICRRGTRCFWNARCCYLGKFLLKPMWEFTAHFADVFGLNGWRWKWWRCVRHVIVISPFPFRRLDRWIGLARLTFSKIPQNSFCWPWAHRMIFAQLTVTLCNLIQMLPENNADLMKRTFCEIFCPQIWVAGTHRVWSARDLWRHGSGDMKRVR